MPETIEQTAWLIEWPNCHGGHPSWWHPKTGWMPVADQAARFARKDDAEAYIAVGSFCADVVATEHMWLDCAIETEKERQTANARLIAAGPPPSAWRPIESAPKDGTPIIVLLAHRPFLSVCTASFDGRGATYDCDRSRLDAGPATHWMPMPEAPK